MTDEDIIQCIRKHGSDPGSPALERLYLRWGIAMKTFFMSRGLSVEDAEDVLAETVIKIWRNAHSYHGEANAQAWICGRSPAIH